VYNDEPQAQDERYLSFKMLNLFGYQLKMGRFSSIVHFYRVLLSADKGRRVKLSICHALSC